MSFLTGPRLHLTVHRMNIMAKKGPGMDYGVLVSSDRNADSRSINPNAIPVKPVLLGCGQSGLTSYPKIGPIRPNMAVRSVHE